MLVILMLRLVDKVVVVLVGASYFWTVVMVLADLFPYAIVI